MGTDDNANICKIALPDTERFCIVDIADQVLVAPFRWKTLKGRNTTYVRTWIPGIGDVLMHHHLLGGIPPNGFVVDHINGDGLDNRRANLQIISNADNIRRSSKPTAGVYFLKRLKRKPWRSEVTVDSVKYHLGYFETQEDAIAARNSFLISRGKEVRTLDKR